MEVKINVDESMFKEVLEKELNAFSKEELHEIVRDCIVEALRNDTVIRSLFTTHKRNIGGWNPIEEPSEVLIEAAKSIDLSPAYKEIQEMMISELKTNYEKMLRDVMLKTIVDGLCSDYNFKNNVKSVVSDIIYEARNNN